MERMVVVVFDNELKAYDGSRVLKELDAENSISIHAKAVIMKNADGKVEIKDEGDEFPIRTVSGTAIGALVGLLGGPIGLGIGAVAGTFTGLILDMNRAGINAEFLDDVSNKLTPGKWAVIADISEDWETPLDTRMAALGGNVFRTTRQKVVTEQDAKDVAAMKADIAHLKAEQAKSKADQKVKIQAKIDKLNTKVHTKLEQAKQRSERRQAEVKAKIGALEKKASKAKGEPKAKIEARISELQELAKEASNAFDEFEKEVKAAFDEFDKEVNAAFET